TDVHRRTTLDGTRQSHQTPGLSIGGAGGRGTGGRRLGRRRHNGSNHGHGTDRERQRQRHAQRPTSNRGADTGHAGPSPTIPARRRLMRVAMSGGPSTSARKRSAHPMQSSPDGPITLLVAAARSDPQMNRPSGQALRTSWALTIVYPFAIL